MSEAMSTPAFAVYDTVKECAIRYFFAYDSAQAYINSRLKQEYSESHLGQAAFRYEIEEISIYE